MREKIYEVPGKFVGYYYPESRTIVDIWEDLSASFEDWKNAIYDIGILKFAPENEVTTWVTDTSSAKGVFDKQIQDFREEVSAAAMANSGVKLFFTVTSSSAIATLSARKTSKAYTGHGDMKSITVSSVEEAFEVRDKEMAK